MYINRKPVYSLSRLSCVCGGAGAGVGSESFPSTREQVLLHTVGYLGVSFCYAQRARLHIHSEYIFFFTLFCFFEVFPLAYGRAMGLVSGLFDRVWRKSQAEKAHLDGKTGKAWSVFAEGVLNLALCLRGRSKTTCITVGICMGCLKCWANDRIFGIGVYIAVLLFSKVSAGTSSLKKIPAVFKSFCQLLLVDSYVIQTKFCCRLRGICMCTHQNIEQSALHLAGIECTHTHTHTYTPWIPAYDIYRATLLKAPAIPNFGDHLGPSRIRHVANQPAYPFSWDDPFHRKEDSVTWKPCMPVLYCVYVLCTLAGRRPA